MHTNTSRLDARAFFNNLEQLLYKWMNILSEAFRAPPGLQTTKFRDSSFGLQSLVAALFSCFALHAGAPTSLKKDCPIPK